MKIITIGDIHGYDTWKKAINYSKINNEIHISQFDLIIFVGDYVDDRIKTDMEILNNLLEIIELKKRYPSKVILLWGNHDVQYLLGTKKHGCSGYRPSMWFKLHSLFTENEKLFQLAFQIDNYLWTHAGVTIGFYNFQIKNQKYVIRDGVKLEWLEIDKSGNISDILNFCFEARHQPIFDCGIIRDGDAKVGGPLWADFIELYKKPIPNLNQIVGHTRRKKIDHYTNYKNKDTSTTFVDCMHLDYNEYYILDI